jgi:hypothetical protein
VGPRHPMLNWGLHQGPTYELLLLASVSGELASVSGKHYINYSLRFRASLLRFRASITTTLTTRFGFGRAILASVSGKHYYYINYSLRFRASYTCFGFGQATNLYLLRFRASNKTCQCRTNSRIEIHPARGGLGTGRAVHSSRVTPYIYMRWSPTYYRWAVPSCPLRVRCNNVIDTMFSPNPAPSTAGSGYTRARTPQGGTSRQPR